MGKIVRDCLPQVVFWGGGVTLIVTWGLVAFVGPGSIMFWEWTADSWQAVAIGLTGWVLAIIAAKAWEVQSRQAALEQLRFELDRSRADYQVVSSFLEEQTPAQLISRAHIAASGSFIGQTDNIMGVTDGGVGQRDIIWNQDYANADYHVSITPTAGHFEIERKSVGSISIRTFDYQGQPTDIELDILAIGDA